MSNKIKNILIGKPLANEELKGEKLNVFWGLPVMAGDAISSVAYGVEEILWVLVPAVGSIAYRQTLFVAGAIVVLLLVLVFSYRQTINSYPNGGGSYTVAKENLGELPGLAACASLFVGYVLTVAVSICAGTAALTSAIPELAAFKVPIAVFLLGLMSVGNLRGVRESARIFAIPTYIFIVSMLVLIATGLAKVYIFGYTPAASFEIPQGMGDITLFLLVRAYAAGCAGLTGVEAVSNAVPNFFHPAQKNAKKVLSLLALFVLLIFGGTSFLATIFHAVPNYDVTVLSQISLQVFGNGVMYYILQIATTVILVMAANTSFAGLPTLLSLAAGDGYAPRQFALRGGRLGFSNGILTLSFAAGLLIIVYKAETHDLVPLYAIGVFIAFTLSQLGMLAKWIKSGEKGRLGKALVNGVGSFMTVVTVVIIASSKMLEGAWISLVFIAVLVCFMKMVRRHYDDVARQLKLEAADIAKETEILEVDKHMIVIVESLNKASLKAINYARHLADDKNIVAFNISVDTNGSEKIKAKWEECGIPIPLVVKYSPFREIVEPLAEYIKSEEHESNPGDMITVVMPQFVVGKMWENILHSQTSYMIRRKLLHDRHIAVITVPYVLDE